MGDLALGFSPNWVGATGYGAPGGGGVEAAAASAQPPVTAASIMQLPNGGFVSQLCVPAGFPTAPECAIPAQLDYFGGFADVFGGVAPIFAPNQGTTNYYAGEIGSPH